MKERTMLPINVIVSMLMSMYLLFKFVVMLLSIQFDCPSLSSEFKKVYIE